MSHVSRVKRTVLFTFLQIAKPTLIGLCRYWLRPALLAKLKSAQIYHSFIPSPLNVNVHCLDLDVC